MTAGKRLCIAVLLGIAFAGCSGQDGGDEQFANGGTYTERLPSDPGNLHPLRAQAVTTNNVVPFAYDTLINVDAKGRVVPQLATKWDVKPSSVTFTLRKDVTCADGSKLTVADVAKTFEWVKDPKNQSTIIGFRLPSNDFTVKANDRAATVTITVGEPYGALLQGAGLVPIVCPKGLADPNRLAHKTLGTGPFNVVDYVADDHLTLAARKDYRWGPGGAGTQVPGFPARVVFKVVQNETTASNLLLADELTTHDVEGPDAARLEGRGYDEIPAFTGPDELWFNQRDGHPGADPRVRRALAMALNLDDLTKGITEGTGRRATSLTVVEPRPCRLDTVAGSLPARDADAAGALLDQAGFAAGEDGMRAKDGQPLEITLLYATGGGAPAMELVADWWQDLGVDVELKTQDTNAFIETLFAGSRWDAAILGVNISYPGELVSNVSGPASPEGENFAAVSNPDYERLAERALATPGRAGCQLWAEADRTLLQDVDVVPISDTKELTFANKARIRKGVNGTEPTSIRLLEG